MTKKFSLTCPDELCEKEFEYEADPDTIGDGGELIACPKCGEEWEWEYNMTAGTLELLPDEVEDKEDFEEEITGVIPEDGEFADEDEDEEDEEDEDEE